jgi:sugar/nucleoside kinase (ribokinase family)
MERSGITAGGNFIRDYTRIIDDYPKEETLANILAQDSSNGGAAYNVLKNLSKMGVPFPLSAIGCIGNDESGKEILNDCNFHHIDTTGMVITDQAGTSYTDVMVVRKTGKRTFFHYRGANARLAPEHFDFNHVNAKIFHLGYLLLLDTLDQFDNKGRTLGSYVLEKAMQAGLMVTVDLVSVNTDAFNEVILPSLPFIDYLFLNDFEAGKLTGININLKEHIHIEKAIEACDQILDYGVNNSVILHFPEGAIARSRNSTHMLGSVQYPADQIAGTTGAGDAFASGYLYGIHENLPERECLRMGASVAASSLCHETCSEGIHSLEVCLAHAEQYGFRKL